MKRNPSLRFAAALLTLLCLSLFPGCKKKVPTPDPVENTQAKALSLLSVAPSEGQADKATPVTLAGAGFQQGVQVRVGDAAALDVEMLTGKVRATVPSGLKPGRYDVVVRNPDGEEARLAGAFTVRANEATPTPRPSCELATIYFGFDEATLSDSSRDTLQRNVECLKARGTKRVQVEGHCDERGSTDYNLALGQRRADAVMKYLRDLGFSDVTSISYGEERPAATGEGEEVWAKNRRAELRPQDTGVAKQ